MDEDYILNACAVQLKTRVILSAANCAEYGKQEDNLVLMVLGPNTVRKYHRLRSHCLLSPSAKSNLVITEQMDNLVPSVQNLKSVHVQTPVPGLDNCKDAHAREKKLNKTVQYLLHHR